MPVATAASVNTQLSFLSSTLKEKPYIHTQDFKDTNITSEEHDVTITDLRSLSESELAGFHTDTSGFQWVKNESSLKGADFFDEEKVKTLYYPEVDQFLKSTLGATRTFIFDHTTRHAQGVDNNKPEGPGNRGPGLRAHVDQSPKAGAERVFLHLGEDAERLSKVRAQIVNVWRPIRGPVRDYPLAVADYRTIKYDTDLQATDFIYPHRKGETFSVRYGDHQKWYYISNQEPDDVILLKCYESDVVPGRARLTPHSAFLNPESAKEENVLPRQSIEVRALVFYE